MIRAMLVYQDLFQGASQTQTSFGWSTLIQGGSTFHLPHGRVSYSEGGNGGSWGNKCFREKQEVAAELFLEFVADAGCHDFIRL